MEFGQSPQRTILYYPTITVPNGVWLRRALLYWDRVASIVPAGDYSAFESEAYTQDAKYLSDAGAFREIDPVSLFDQFPITVDFVREFESTVTSDRFRRLLASGSGQFRGSIHEFKLNDEIMGILHRENLIEPREERDRRGGPWVSIEGNTALLYMSLLAKYLSYVDSDATVTGTDREEYFRLNYAPLAEEDPIGCFEIQLANILPVPREDIPVGKILEFKQNRRMELLEFRTLMDEFHKQLSETSDQHTANLVLAQFRERIEKGLNDLSAQLRDARIATIGGSLSALIKPQERTLGSLLFGAVASVPIAVGGAISGLLKVGEKFISARNERRERLRDSPFSYLYHAERELRPPESPEPVRRARPDLKPTQEGAPEQGESPATASDTQSNDVNQQESHPSWWQRLFGR